ncbi:MAG TPA: protein kinase [Kofleriaceae bacterium]|nr:protein kinase [Kofleriaceae bacterium]
MVGPGTILGGKYRVERVLGEGGMGMVVAATHVQLGTPFALKFIHEGMVANQSLLDRFMREARAAAKLKGDHVCRVADVTMLEGRPCLVMEQLDGIDLGHLLKQQGRFPVTTAVDYVIQACAGMAEAHGVGIIHRDLKPGNLFLTHRMDGTPLIKILDFGVAKAMNDENTELTASNVILGSPSYMSLEQIRSSRTADSRSDIWSLGIILYELVAGHRPFNGEGIADLALKIAMEPTPKLPFGPAPLDVVIGKCLQKPPALRYQNVAELAAALTPFASDAGKSLATSIMRVVRASSSSGQITTPIPAVSAHDMPTTLQSAAGVRPGGGTRTATWILLPLVGLLIAGGVGFALSKKSSPAASTTPATPSETPSAPPSGDVQTPTPTPQPQPQPVATPDAAIAAPPVDAAAPAPVDAGVAAPSDAGTKKPRPKTQPKQPKSTDFEDMRI